MLEQERFRHRVTKKFFPVMVVRHWNRLSRETMEGSPPEVSKARLDRTLSKPV